MHLGKGDWQSFINLNVVPFGTRPAKLILPGQGSDDSEGRFSQFSIVGYYEKLLLLIFVLGTLEFDHHKSQYICI